MHHEPRADRPDVELAITGMTCASCANRIERKLNKLDGVTATVNYATEKAKVTYPDAVSADDLVAHRRAGRLRRRAARRRPTSTEPTTAAEDPTRRLRQRLLVSRRAHRARSSRWRWSRRCSSPTGSGSR